MLQRRYSLTPHHARERLINEAHARPAQPCAPHAQVSMLALLAGEGERDADRAHVARLCVQLGQPEPSADARHHVLDAGAARLVWERHTEFFVYTMLRHADPAQPPFRETALDAIDASWIAQTPGEVLAAAHMAVLAAPQGELDPAIAQTAFGRDDYAASRVRGATACVAADFRLQGDGFARMILFDSAEDDLVRGRMVQKLLDIETYRLGALLALPVARAAQPDLARLEEDLAAMSQRLAAPPHVAKDRDLLQRLSQLAGAAEALEARCGYRFAAAQAYRRIVEERIDRLREERVADHERVGVFMERRFAPAMRTCEAASARQEALAARIARATQLLATRVDVAVEEQNARLLSSMDRRAALQIRLQETVEGLSAIAITYYGVGLVAYLAKGAQAAGASAVDPALAAAIATPVVFGLVWLGVRRLRQRMHAGSQAGEGAPSRTPPSATSPVSARRTS